MPRIIADLEIHSRFSRAVSKDMNLASLEQWGALKGIELIGTGDFTHPTWFSELKAELEEDGTGFLKRKNSASNIRFLLSAEISCIFGRNGTRRIHTLVYAPDLATAEKVNARLSTVGKLKSDGRPIIGIDIKELLKIILDVSPECVMVPAHVWTPWFGMYGSNSGFDSLKECFGELVGMIPAIETGLSSDPPMNWRLSELDAKTIVLYSDAHSPRNIGREATIFEFEEPTYANYVKALHIPFPKKTDKNRIVMTTEFFPEEGMYHWDGHRSHGLRMSPAETRKAKGVCPKCGGKLTVGVAHRVDKLADRPEGYAPKGRPPFIRLIQLSKIIGEALDLGHLTKTVEAEYHAIISNYGSEFNVLLNVPLDELAKHVSPIIVEGIKRVREGKLHIEPGYDGTYGIVKIFTDAERKKMGQSSLF